MQGSVPHTFLSSFDSPVGIIEIAADEQSILSVSFKNESERENESANRMENALENEISISAKNQLQEYFSSARNSFDLPLKFSGTEFQNRVWLQLQQIPFGKTISYLQLAKNLGDAKCIRAAGTANGKNPFAVVVPCHRVVGSNDDLVGYAGGLWRKRWLLEHESKQQSLF